MHASLAFLSWTTADLINHLWQSSVIALALLFLMALCGRLSARTRLALGWMALAKFALPFGIFALFVTLLGGQPEQWSVSRLFPVPFNLADSSPGVLAVDTAFVGPAIPEPADPAALAASTAAQGESPVGQGLPGTWSLPQVLAFAWLAGCTGLYGWWIIGGLRLRRRLLAEATEVSPAMAAHLAAAATKAGVRNLPRCLSVPHGSGPGLLGVWAPILTLPPGLEEKLTPAELESVLLHELIHLQRRDPFWLALHVAAVSALWFNPLAWFLSRWIRLETEKACDERVLEITGRPDTYAQGILKVVHLALGLPEPRLLSVITPPVVSRVKNILRHGSRPDHRWLRVAALASGGCLLALGGQVGSFASAAVIPETASAAPKTPDGTGEPSRGAIRASTVTGEPFAQRSGNWSFTPLGATAGPNTLPALSNAEPQPVGELVQGWDGVTAFRGSIKSAMVDIEVKRQAELMVRIATEQVTLASARERYLDQHPVVQAQAKVLQDLLVEQQGRTANGNQQAPSQQMAIATVVRQLGLTKEELAKLQLNLSGNAPEMKAKLGEIDRLENILTAVRNGTFGRASEVPMPMAQPDPAPTSAVPTAVDLLAKNLEVAKAELVTLRERYMEQHPRVQQQLATIASLESRSREVSVVMFAQATVPAAPAPATRARDAAGRDTLSIDFPDQEIRGILRSVADLFELNIIIPETLEGKTTVKLQDVTWRQIFKTILDPLDHIFLEEGKIIRIVRKPPTPPAVSTVIESKIIEVAEGDVRDLGVTWAALSQGAAAPAEGVRLNPVNSVAAPAPETGSQTIVYLRDPTSGPNAGLELDRLPSPFSQKPPVYPASLTEKQTEGSVTVGFVVDSVGNVLNVRVISSTHRDFEQAAMDAVKLWRFQAGKKGGKLVATNMSVVLNFRPPAAVKTSDTTQPSAVFAAASIATPAPAPRPRVEPSAPGMTMVFELKDLDQIPTPTLQVGPNYPADLKRKGTEGFAEVAFVVDAQGNVQNARVLSSSMREFERAALEAVAKWKFKPGRKGGKPVATNMSVPINFHLSGARKTASTPPPAPVFAAASAPPAVAAAQSAPATAAPIVPVQPVTPQVYALRELDTIPSPTLQVPPVYPADLKRMGVEGRANISFVVDEKGQVQNVRASDSTDPRFEQAAINAVSRWKFKPGRKAGKPVATALDVPINFHLNGNK